MKRSIFVCTGTILLMSGGNMAVITELPNSLPHGPRNVYLLEFLGNNVIVQSHDPPKRLLRDADRCKECVFRLSFYFLRVHMGLSDFVN